LGFLLLKEVSLLQLFKAKLDGLLKSVRLAAIVSALPLVFMFDSHETAFAQDDDGEKFEDVEIRVIRPRYFNKRKRFELGAQLSSVMNETFIYTYLATGIASYHFSEKWSLAVSGSFGFSLNKRDKEVLFDEFQIKTKILRTLYSFDGQLQFTPMYGKWQTSSGRLIYFDTFLTGGFGLTGISYKYNDFCTAPTAKAKEGNDPPSDIPADTTVSYPTMVVGLGQRYFMTKTLSYNVGIKNHTVFAQKADGSCDTNHPESGSFLNHNTLIQIGASKYF
jgi:outer membrane beta-barrel protein